ncbi:carboxypeptidase-like regulatory domain-containing protein, partial [Bacteroidota bacterium]
DIVEEKYELIEAITEDAEVEIMTDNEIEIVEFEEEEEVIDEDLEFYAEVDEVKDEEMEETEISDEVIAQVPAENVSTALQGKVAGVQVKKNRKTLLEKENDKSEEKLQNRFASKENNSITIRGKIIGAEDELSIPGVSIVLKDNPTLGTTTDIEGEFSLTLPDDDELKTLIASFVGMKTTEFDLASDTNLLVYMESEVLEMDEVVVVAYGVSREEDEGKTITYAKPPSAVSKVKYKQQIIENLNYTKLADYPGKYKIKLSFTVASDGTVHSFIFKNVPNETFSSEIINVIKELGRWIPAIKNDEKISTTVNLTLKIEI